MGTLLLLAALGLCVQGDSVPARPSRAGATPPAAGLAQPSISLTLEGEVDQEFAPTVARLVALYYECYPKLLARFDHPEKPATRHVRLVFRKGMKIPAAASNGRISISIDWLKKHPNDVGLLTHELTHLVQHYPSPEPGWLTEGLADYARELYGPKEAAGGWSLPRRLTEKQSWKDSYRTTARFLMWLDKEYPGSVDQLHRRMQDRDFELGHFKSITGKSIEELWSACVEAGKEPL